MFRKARFGLVAGVMAVVAGWAGATTVPAAVAAVAAGLERAGYTNVRVTERIFGGFAIEGRKGGDFAIITLDARGEMLDHAELFRDKDGDGVFETNETLGTPGRGQLRDLVVSSLKEPVSTERVVQTGNVENAGFGQGIGTLFAQGGLRVDAHERLGSGGLATEEKVISLAQDGVGMQRRGERRFQQQSVSGLGLLSLSATTAAPGGAVGSFAPLTVDVPQPVDSGVDGAAIRSEVAANSPDATALRAQITANAPSASALTQQITSAAPTAESIKAGIAAPTAPPPP